MADISTKAQGRLKKQASKQTFDEPALERALMRGVSGCIVGLGDFLSTHCLVSKEFEGWPRGRSVGTKKDPVFGCQPDTNEKLERGSSSTSRSHGEIVIDHSARSKRSDPVRYPPRLSAPATHMLIAVREGQYETTTPMTLGPFLCHCPSTMHVAELTSQKLDEWAFSGSESRVRFKEFDRNDHRTSDASSNIGIWRTCNMHFPSSAKPDALHNLL
jgi:hypothetical protein